MKKVINKFVCVFGITTLMLGSMSGCGNNKASENVGQTDEGVKTINENSKETIDESDTISYSLGDIVTFGTFEQDDNEDNGAEPIEWIVLDTEGSKSLLISKYVLEEDFYDLNVDSLGNWYTSDVYQWLNSDFINNSFSEAERKRIIQSEYGNVFLLSFDEAVKYFNMKPVQQTHATQKFEYTCYYSQDAFGVPTKKVIEHNIDDKEMTQEKYDNLMKKGINYDASIVGEVYIPYWLRTHVDGDTSCTNGIDEMGRLIDKNISSPLFILNSRNGIRPAIWIGEENNNSQAEDTKETLENTKRKADLKNSTKGISRFYGYDLPLIFSLDYEYADDDTLIYNIEDKGDYYLVSGSIVCPECVKQDDLKGTFETKSGHKYTIVGRESYNNDQREKILLSGGDGKEYTISNIPAFMLDTYTKEIYYPISNENNEYFKTIFENVVLRIDKDTVFFDGNSAGDTFETAVNNGTFENATYSIAYDIHFTEDGSIDILTPSDIGSNGVMGWC